MIYITKQKFPFGLIANDKTFCKPEKHLKFMVVIYIITLQHLGLSSTCSGTNVDGMKIYSS